MTLEVALGRRKERRTMVTGGNGQGLLVGLSLRAPAVCILPQPSQLLLLASCSCR